jgi:hypothetical protein
MFGKVCVASLRPDLVANGLSLRATAVDTTLAVIHDGRYESPIGFSSSFTNFLASFSLSL